MQQFREWLLLCSNFDVNVNVQVDTMPIALSFLCLALAKKELTRQEFESAVEALTWVILRYALNR